DVATGGRIYERVNLNGNWNTRGFFSFNTPLKNKKFTISSNTGGSYSDAVSYTGVGKEDAQLSTTHNSGVSERLSGNYRNEFFDLSLNGSINYNKTQNSKQINSNRETFDNYFGGNTNINLPWTTYLSTDANVRIKKGYSGNFNNRELIWNAQLSKSFLKNNAATIRIKIYDILQQQSNLSRNISETMMSDTEYNTLGSYFMVHFVYRLNTLGGRKAGGPGNRQRPDFDGGAGGGYRDRGGRGGDAGEGRRFQ
ncbi:MAG: outer membrane beta-barrel family protein, partial [Mediterranea sp.]|nr:outer membrane beta-barrel family protein [Mediterranea sp.]